MKKVQEHIDEKLKNEPGFRERYNLIMQKAEIAKKIIGYRIKHNLTQKQLADDLDVSQQYISKIEEGDFSTLDTVDHILFKMGCRLILKVEESPYTTKAWKKIEKIVAEKGNTYKSRRKSKRHIKGL
ncbi:MAG: helix-turn-helix domain-containing protein [Candidatus Omnitrophica bacterium]|nr:helix-turn-helix domain-containing protein [Candidatus Omnitrophota bacterium]